jgi:dynein heavy chain
MFPSLVSCCTIDWFMDWPQEALLSVAQDALKPLGDDELVNNLANICVIMHEVWNPLCQFLAARCKP